MKHLHMTQVFPNPKLMEKNMDFITFSKSKGVCSCRNNNNTFLFIMRLSYTQGAR